MMDMCPPNFRTDNTLLRKQTNAGNNYRREKDSEEIITILQTIEVCEEMNEGLHGSENYRIA